MAKLILMCHAFRSLLFSLFHRLAISMIPNCVTLSTADMFSLYTFFTLAFPCSKCLYISAVHVKKRLFTTQYFTSRMWWTITSKVTIYNFIKSLKAFLVEWFTDFYRDGHSSRYFTRFPFVGLWRKKNNRLLFADGFISDKIE